jgi:NADP-dependent 3-hydroxy acid dehydrogenase YdfG
MTDIYSLAGRTALVTGASGALGGRFAKILHAAGASLVVAGRNRNRLEALRDQLGQDRVTAAEMDVTDPASIKSAFDTMPAYPGRSSTSPRSWGCAREQR